jgi:putative Mg2+ transporter-C (MgtC) family protein
MESHQKIRGLTTAAGLWITAAIGVEIGLGHLGTAAIGVLFAWFVLAVVIKLDRRIDRSDDSA